MKLLYCHNCNDVRALYLNQNVECKCGQSWGRYTDNANAVYGGMAYPIGFNNNSFLTALSMQPNHDECDGGAEFTAFVIPRMTPSITRE